MSSSNDGDITPATVISFCKRVLRADSVRMSTVHSEYLQWRNQQDKQVKPEVASVANEKLITALNIFNELLDQHVKLTDAAAKAFFDKNMEQLAITRKIEFWFMDRTNK